MTESTLKKEEFFILEENLSMDFLKDLEKTIITEDEGVIKYLSSNFENQPYPIEGQKCRIRYEGRTQNGQLIDMKRDLNQEINVQLFKDNYIDGIHWAISKLAVGEHAWFKFKPSVNVPKEMQKMETFEQIISFYIEKKEEGNQLYAQKNYQIALQRYLKAINQYSCFPKRILDSLTSEQQFQLNTVMSKLHSNIAQCEINMRLYKDAIDSCEKSDKFIQNDQKNLSRFAQCYIGLCEFQLAFDYLEKIKTISKEDEAVNERMRFCKDQLRKQKQKEKKMFSFAIQKSNEEEQKEIQQKKNKIKNQMIMQRQMQNLNIQNEELNKEKSNQQNDKENYLQQLQQGCVLDQSQVHQILNFM